MPGLLRHNARCPLCETPLCALVDHTNRLGVRRNYYHEKPDDGSRRKGPCSMMFTNREYAARERRGLEAPMRKGQITKQYQRFMARRASST